MERNKSLTINRDDRENLEEIFTAIFDRPYENPTEAEYIHLILGLFNMLQKVTKFKGKRGRPPKKNTPVKIELYLAMRKEMRELQSGSDVASQALYKKNSFGRSNWKALKGAYFSYRKDLIDEFLGDDLEIYESLGLKEDVCLRMILSPERLEKP